MRSSKTSLLAVVALGLALIAGLFITDRATHSNAVKNEYSGSVEFGGLTRTYYIHLPPSYDGTKLAPLTLVFHGLGGNGKWIERGIKLDDVADGEGFIVVYPDGYEASWSDGSGVTPAGRAGVDDVGFVSALIDKLANELRIDLSRVYATGFSNGGMFSQRLACELSDKIAAVASVGGTMTEKMSSRCSPKRPVSVIHIHGTDDPVVPWGGGEVRGVGIPGWRILSAPETVKKWVTINTCPSSKKTSEFDDISVRREMYGKCNENTEVILYTVEGGEHTWPDVITAVQLPSSTSGKADPVVYTEEVIWEFFERHPKK